MGLQVLLYWPNIVGYIRIGLVFAAWAAYETAAAFIPVYSLCISLDGVDGWLARRLGQTSRFGACLDVAVDNLGRGMLWSLLFEASINALENTRALTRAEAVEQIEHGQVEEREREELLMQLRAEIER